MTINFIFKNKLYDAIFRIMKRRSKYLTMEEQIEVLLESYDFPEPREQFGEYGPYDRRYN